MVDLQKVIYFNLDEFTEFLLFVIDFLFNYVLELIFYRETKITKRK